MLARFIQALQGYEAELGYNTFWRYAKAQRLPKIVRWIAERPELARALAADAEELARQRTEERPIIAVERG